MEDLPTLSVPDSPDRKEFQIMAGKIWDKHHPYEGSSKGRPTEILEIFKYCREVVPILIETRKREKQEYHSKNSHTELEYSCSACKRNKKLRINQSNIYEAIEAKYHFAPATARRHIKAWMVIQTYYLELELNGWLRTELPEEWDEVISKEHLKEYKNLQWSLFGKDTQKDEFHSLDIASFLCIDRLILPPTL